MSFDPEEDTLEEIDVIKKEEKDFPSKDHETYERLYGRDTAEEEMIAILDSVSKESSEVSQILGVAQNIILSMESIERMDDIDRQPALRILSNLVQETGFNLDNMSFENDDFVYSEGLMSSLFRWAGEAIVAAFKLIGYSLKRGAIFLSRTRKSAEGIEKRLTKLDALMKSRKSEKNRIFFDKSRLAMLVEEYEVNRTPAGSISTFVGVLYSIIDDYMTALRKISDMADKDLNGGEDKEIDIKKYEEVIEDLLDGLEKKFKDKDELIGNRYIKIDKTAKLTNVVSLGTGRPDPKSIIGKFRPMDSLTNSEVESQRTQIRSGSLKKMYKMIDDTSDDLEKMSKFSTTKYKDKEKSENSPDKSEVAPLGKFLNSTTKDLIEGVFVISKIAYDLIDTNVALLEDSVSVTKLTDDRVENKVTRNIGKRIGKLDNPLE